MSNTIITICLHCATPLVSGAAKVIQCPYCGTATSRERVERALRYARDVYQFGVQYRRRYQADFDRDGRCDHRYSLITPSSLWDLVTLAILSGVIGNAAYDVVKAAMRRVLDYAVKNIQSEESASSRDDKARVEASREAIAQLRAVLENESQLEELFSFIREINADEMRVSVHVKNAIASEIWVHGVEEELESQGLTTIDMLNPDTRKRVEKVLNGMRGVSADILIRKRRPPDSEFDNLWSKVHS